MLLALPLFSLGTLVWNLQASASSGSSGPAFVVLFSTIGALGAWQGSGLLAAERRNGILAYLMFAPSGTRALVRTEALRQAVEVFVLIVCLLSGALAATLGAPSERSVGLATSVVVNALLAGACAMVIWSLAGVVQLMAGDPISAFGTGAVAVVGIVKLHDLMRDRLEQPVVLVAWLVVSVAITVLLEGRMERMTEDDTWRLRNSRL
jgi:hypothetical protein